MFKTQKKVLIYHTMDKKDCQAGAGQDGERCRGGGQSVKARMMGVGRPSEPKAPRR